MAHHRRAAMAAGIATLALAGCTIDPTGLPLPGGADVGDDPYQVTIEFRDVLDLVPNSAVRVDDIVVGRVTDIELEGWNASVTVELNGDVALPANAEATIRQSSLLGEKFVSLSPPATGSAGELSDGDEIAVEQSGRNPEIEEVLGAASLLLNGGGLEKVNTIVTELNAATAGNEPEIKALIDNTNAFLAQIDANTGPILTALEKVNNLAVTANRQEGAINAALDHLPAALTVLDEQRDDLVALTTALQQLGDTATGVIADSREDTIANLQSLQPVLANLAASGEDLVANLSTLLTFPFPDSAVGATLAGAQQYCPRSHELGDGGVAETAGGCGGDFMNLNVNLDLDLNLFATLLQPYLDVGTLLPNAPTTEVPQLSGPEQLSELVQELAGPAPQADPAPQESPSDEASADPADPSGEQPATPEPSEPSQAPAAEPNIVCRLSGLLCRPAVAPASATAESRAELTDLLLMSWSGDTEEASR